MLAHYDDEHIVVYQAFHEVTAAYAVEHQRLGGPRYKLTRMSWLKPNFLWMMYRCGWLAKDDEQGRVLAITMRRAFFDELLEAAVASSYPRRGNAFTDKDEWKEAVQRSEVRLQWDPDHAPGGAKEERRAIQLGLRGETLRRFVEEATHRIEDVSDFALREREHRADASRLQLPKERPYPITSARARRALGLSE